MRASGLIGITGMAWALMVRGTTPVRVLVSAPHAGLAARIGGPSVTLVRGRQIRSGDGYVVVSTPAEAIVDPSLSDCYIQLEPDTARVTVEVETGLTSGTATGFRVLLKYVGTALAVVGAARQEAVGP